jgi:hypothetical protein
MEEVMFRTNMYGSIAHALFVEAETHGREIMYMKTVKVILMSFIFLLTAVIYPMPSGAESITWDGDTSRLKPDPIYPGDSPAFFPNGSVRNTVIIPQGTSFSDHNTVYGGTYAGQDKAIVAENSVLSSGNVHYISGGASLYGLVSNNHVTINGGTTSDITGGESPHGSKVQGNIVTLNNGTVNGQIAGGYAGDGNVDMNQVFIYGGSANEEIYGGVSNRGRNVSSNTVTVSGGQVSNNIYGGAGSNEVYNNHVYIRDNAHITNGNITGGLSLDGLARENGVEISGGSFAGHTGHSGYGADIIGGQSNHGASERNKVILNNIQSGIHNVFGGKGYESSQKNIVEISNSKVNGDVFGNYASNGLASYGPLNVNIQNSTIAGEVYGGYGKTAIGNSVVINGTVTESGGSKIFSSKTGNVIGGRSYQGEASGNQVRIINSWVSGYVAGGEAVSGAAESNFVTIMNKAWIQSDVYGGRAHSGNAEDNTVSITGGTIIGNIYGGWAANTSQQHTASNNTIIIGGEKINDVITGINTGDIKIQGTIYGGYANSGPNDKAVNNTVILLGAPDLTLAEIKPGYVDHADADAFSGNKLVVATDTTAVVKSVANVENYEFVLPANAGDGYVALKSDITFGTTAGGTQRASKVTDISLRGGGAPLQPGDSIALFRKLDGSEYTDIADAALTGLAGRTIPGRKGISLLYEYGLDNTGTARVNRVLVNPQTKALSEGRVAGAAFLNQGGDLLAYQGISTAKAAANAKIGMSAFALTSGGWSRYNTGSHVDVSGVSLLAGLAIGGDLPVGRITAGGFFEGGWGNYDSYNSFGSYASVKGSGDTSYVGGGVFGRLDLNNTGPGHFYGELSGRMGAQYTDFSSANLRDPIDDRKANYNLEGAYYGLHTGLGYIWDINESASLDLSGKYFWTHQEGGSVSILGDPFKFDDVNSHRVRTGGRFAYAVNEHFSPYIGAAYEYEFSGEAKATTYGRSIEAPDLTGSTGIGEIGVTLIGGDKAPVSLDLGVQGYTGMRQGVTGSLQLKLEF